MTPPLFIFGTLRHGPLFEAVIGDVSHLDLKPAVLPGFAVRNMAEGAYPTLRPTAAEEAEGLLVSGLTPQDYAALDLYERIFGYERCSVALAGGADAQTYMPPDGAGEGGGTWSLERWAAEWGEISLRSAREIMRFHRHRPPEEIAQMFPMIRARAASEINAESSRHGALTLQGHVNVVAQRRPYARYFAVDEYDLRHEKFDGSQSPVVLRAVFRAPDATLVLPYDARRDRVLLVEQFRMGPLARGDRSLWQLEPIAGRLDPGETPEAAARREAMEEAGLILGTLHEVAEAYCSPGNSSEFYYMYVGDADLPDHSPRIGGLDAEDEDIRSHIISFDEMMAMCDRLAFANAPLLILAFWLARHRDRLRAAVGL